MSLGGHLAQPWKTRRYLLILSNLVALGLAVFCTVTQVELKGQELITILVVGNNAVYGVTKWRDGKKD
jgi:hypothetical protein